MSSSDKSSNGEVAIDQDVPSYDSIKGILRPYLLAGATAIAYMEFSHDPNTVEYGFLLPWAISLYVRDNNPSGILESINQNLAAMNFLKNPIETKT